MNDSVADLSLAGVAGQTSKETMDTRPSGSWTQSSRSGTLIRQ